MGNSFNKYVKIELYKWSSSEFPQEYGLVYTSLDDAFKSSILRLSVNTDMVLCRVAGDMCRNHQVRCHVKITALRDSRGDCKFGEVVVSQDGDINPTVEEESAWFNKFWCEDGGAHIFLKSTEQKLDRNMERTYWEFCYSYDVGDRVTLKYTLLKRNQNGCTPPSAKANSNGSILKKVLFRGEGRGSGGTEASVQGSKVSVNNTGHFQGNSNGSRYENCHVTMNYKAPKPNN